MKNYYLYLDESGRFVEQNKYVLPSIVAGYISENEECTTEWAETLLHQVQEKEAWFASIDISHFHAMELCNPNLPTYNPAGTDFVTQVVSALAQNGIRLVCMKNKRGMNVVDSDYTYLNVFAEGVARLIRHLLLETEDRIFLHILYAHRVFVETTDGNQVRSIPDGERKRIPSIEYTTRIREKIDVRLAELAKGDLDRFAGLELKTGNAKNASPLMIADAVCFALRGGRRNMTNAQLAAIDKVETIVLPVLENTNWERIQNLLVGNQLASAIYTWYGHHDDQELQSKTVEFHKQILDKIKKLGAPGRDSQLQLLSRYVGALVDIRDISSADVILNGLIVDLYPLLLNAGIEVFRSYFDLCFYKLTTATHSGNTADAQKMIDLCENLAGNIPWTLEDLDYIVSYKLRKVEHLKNIFRFKKAEKELRSLAKILSKTKRYVSTIKGRGGKHGNIKSMLLLKITGSLLQTQCYLLAEGKVTAKKIHKTARVAFENAARDEDILRHEQTLAMAAYYSGNVEEALAWLKKAFCLSVNDTTGNLIHTIVKERNEFGLMHYAAIMAISACQKPLLSTQLYHEWDSSGAGALLAGAKNDYPAYLTYWRLAKTRVILKIGDSGNGFYQLAAAMAEKEPANMTFYAAGLAIEADRFGMLADESNFQESWQALSEHLNVLLQRPELPKSMASIFSEWADFLSEIPNYNKLDTYREKMSGLALKVPAL